MLTAVTIATTNTATKIAKPSSHAVGLSSSFAVPTYNPIDRQAATSKIFKIKSSSASQKRVKNPGGCFAYF